MINRLTLNEKNVREAESVGRDRQIFDTDMHGFSITIYPRGPELGRLGRTRLVTGSPVRKKWGSASWPNAGCT